MLFGGITAVYRTMAKPINTPDAKNVERLNVEAVGTYSYHLADGDEVSITCPPLFPLPTPFVALLQLVRCLL
jgi:hypothetical protein